jgi:hypothetical protein
VTGEDLTYEARAASILFAETNIGQRLFFEALRKKK